MKKKLLLTDKDAKDIVVSMASSLDVPYSLVKNECTLQLPKNFGDGIMKSTTFDDGFGIVETRYNLQKDFHIEMSEDIIHPLKIFFNIGHPFLHRLEKDESFKEISSKQVMIVASVPDNNHRLNIPAKADINIFTIEINRKQFEKRIVEYVDEMDAKIATLFRDLNGVMPFAYKGSYSYEIADMINKFITCELEGMPRALYLEAKAFEIFASFIEQYSDDTNRPDKRSIFRQNQIKFIKKSGDFIKANLERLPTVSQLAKESGLSQNVLQNGFRSIYGMSVNEFIQNERLVLAKHLLIESDLQLSEISFRIGLSSNSYFSKIFSEKYGMPPSQFRSEQRRAN